MAGGRLTGRFFAIAILALAAIQNAIGQDSHYWSSQYGTQAQLLGGLVVGSSNDLSSTFYNPGALALTKDSALVLSTLSQQFTDITLHLLSEPPIEAESNVGGPSPGIFALRLPPISSADRGLPSPILSARTSRSISTGEQLWASRVWLLRTMLFSSRTSPKRGSASRGQARSQTPLLLVGPGMSHPCRSASGPRRSGRLQRPDGRGSTIIQFLDFYYNNFRTLFKIGLFSTTGP
ncbi:MAG: hypothetical protein KAJ12_02840 [Bacteroidetes bacterium]|nr:hypothetical protein [Bacteroidota bacterium]